jgi:hypothetical protein
MDGNTLENNKARLNEEKKRKEKKRSKEEFHKCGIVEWKMWK